MHLFYSSRDGQARKIAERIAERLVAAGLAVKAQDLAGQVSPPETLKGLTVVVAAIRYGYHLPEALQFLTAFGNLQAPPPLAFFSVNLTARKPGKQSVEGNAYLRKALLRHRLKPVLACAIAGRLDYPRYTPFDRFMIRFIMTITNGPTDPKAVVEFTDWNQVDDLASQVLHLSGELSS